MFVPSTSYGSRKVGCRLSTLASSMLLMLISVFIFYYQYIDAFTILTYNSKRRHSSESAHQLLKTKQKLNDDGNIGRNFIAEDAAIDCRLYTHDGWTCAYRYKAAQSYEDQQRYTPLLLIHPVGIGLSSWFWTNLMQHYRGEVYAVDLIGCGTIGGDLWDPQVRGMFFPLTWAEQCVTLIQKEIQRPCAVVCQGAVAPVAVVLTHSCPQHISHLVLTSPPEYTDMVQPLPTSTLERNYRFYQSPFWGRLAFAALENRFAIQLFSNLFLFDSPIKADNIFVTNAVNECTNNLLLRTPIMAFNAGLLLHRSLTEELVNIRQPALVLCGESDRSRNKNRQGYQDSMKDSTLKVIRGKNILPWEFPEEVCDELVEFITKPKLS